MSANPNALKEMPSANATNNTNTNTNTNKSSEPKSLSNLGKNEQVLVNKLSPADIVDPDEPISSPTKNTTDEFMASSESEFGKLSAPNKVPTLSDKSVSENNKLSANQSSSESTTNSTTNMSESGTKESTKSTESDEQTGLGSTTELETSADTDDDEKSAAELVAAAAAQIVSKTIKKPSTSISLEKKPDAKTLKATSKLLTTGKQEQVMKKAMLMLNESGRLNVVTDEPMPSIVKLNTPVNKAQIKLRAFRQNFEKQLGEMRRKTPLQMQALRAELANIEFAEIGNKNIMAGLLELVDDHELKLLTIEKMLKHGDITLSF